MTKHIVGLLIFTLIVGTSAVIAGLFGYASAPEADSVTVSETYRVYKKKKRKKRCRKKRPRPREVAATVVQATFDESGRTLTTEVVLGTPETADLELHFFVSDAYGTQYLKKETIVISSSETLYENSFGWLDRLESKENLYVVARPRPASRGWDYPPEFDAALAVPVLVRNDR